MAHFRNSSYKSERCFKFELNNSQKGLCWYFLLYLWGNLIEEAASFGKEKPLHRIEWAINSLKAKVQSSRSSLWPQRLPCLLIIFVYVSPNKEWVSRGKWSQNKDRGHGWRNGNGTKTGERNKGSRGSLMETGSGGAGGTLCCPTLTMSPSHSFT